MHKTQMVLTLGLLLSTSVSFAHGDNGACKTYEATCKTNEAVVAAKGKEHWEAFKTCIATAAKADPDSTKGQACIAAQAKHHHPAPESGAAPAPVPTGN